MLKCEQLNNNNIIMSQEKPSSGEPQVGENQEKMKFEAVIEFGYDDFQTRVFQEMSDVKRMLLKQ